MISRRAALFIALGVALICALFINLQIRNIQSTDIVKFTPDPNPIPHSSPMPEFGSPSASVSTSALDAFFPILETAEDKALSWLAQNSHSLRALVECIQQQSCGARQQDVVILASRYFRTARRGLVSGEEIWCNSITAALDELGYTVVFSDSIYHAATMHALFPSLVRAVVLDEWDMNACATNQTCAKSAAHPLGIPVWKLFSFTFFYNVNEPVPLDARWAIAPEDYSYKGVRRVHIGYTVARTCGDVPLVPPEEREPIAFVFGKHKGYWQDSHFMWSGVDWTRPPLGLEHELGLALPANFSFVACADEVYTDDPKRALPDGVRNLCPDGRHQLPQAEFVAQVSRSRMLIGLGRPWISPTPYEALCMGVPFLNPIQARDRQEPENRTRWVTQHDGLRFEEPPRVYHVYKHQDEALRNREFWTAVLRAVNAPIERYILERMTVPAVRGRVDDWLQHDWRTEAQGLLNERETKGGKVRRLFVL